MKPYLDQKYADRVQKTLMTQIGPLIFPSGSGTVAQLYKRLFGPEFIKTWIQVFIDSSVDREYNYERLEAIGDMVMKLTVITFLNKLSLEAGEGMLTPKQHTETTRKLVTNKYIAPFAAKYKLAPLIKSVRPVNLDMRADIIEALFGALFIIGNEISAGFGYVMSQKLAESLYRDTKLGEVLLLEVDKTKVGQIFQRLGWGENPDEYERYSTETDEEGNKTAAIQVVTTPRTIEWAKNRLRNWKNDPVDWTPLAKSVVELGIGRGYTKTIASDEAYEDAHRSLKSYNLTPEAINYYKLTGQMYQIGKKSEDSDFTKKVLDRLIERLGTPYSADPKVGDTAITRYPVFKWDKTASGKGAVLQLIGFDQKTGKEVILQTVTLKKSGGEDHSSLDAPFRLFQSYLENPQ